MNRGVTGNIEISILCPPELAGKAGAGTKRLKIEMPVYLDLPDIARENRMDEWKAALTGVLEGSSPAAGLVIKNVDELGLCAGFEGPVIADPFLYAYNDEAIRFYQGLFTDLKFIAPDELTDAEAAKLANSGDQIYKIYGRQRVMFTAQNFADNYPNAGEPDEKAQLWEFKSAMGDRLIAVREPYGYTTVYTADPVSMIGRPEAFGRKNILVDFTTENAAYVEAVLKSVADFICSLADEMNASKSKQEKTNASNVEQRKSDFAEEINRMGASSAVKVTTGHHFKGID